MISAVDRPEVPVAVGPASRARRVLLVDEDPGVLGALRIYLLCAGYRVFAAANADEALDRARMATSLIDCQPRVDQCAASNADHGRMQQPPDPHREMPVRSWPAFGAG